MIGKFRKLLRRATLQSGSPPETRRDYKTHMNVYTLFSSLSNLGPLIRVHIHLTHLKFYDFMIYAENL